MEEPVKITTNPTAEECEVLLGRELSPNERNNFALFLAVASARLTALLKRNLDSVEDHQIIIVKMLLARLIGVVSDEQQDAMSRGVVAKGVEDFKVEYDKNSSTPMTHFVNLNHDYIKTLAPKAVIRAGRTDYDGKALCI